MKKLIIIIICSWLFVCNSIVNAQEWKELDSLRDVYLAKQQLDSALIYAEKAAQAVKKQYGEKDTLYADMLSGILVTYYYLGKLEKALEYGLIEKKIRKELQGKTHQDYASSLNNLAAIYDEMGKYDKAEPLYLESMNIDKEILGDMHPSYATDLNNLAYLYSVLGKYEKAEALYIEAKNIYKEVYGIKHTDYATSINNLAALYKNIGNYQKAESLYIEAIDIKKEILGDKHPSYSKSLNNLANLYTTMGEYEKAEPLYLKALSIDKEVLGEKHTSYATSLINIAFLYYEMGDYKKAEPYYIEALAIDREVLGEKHPYYAISLNNLAGLYRTMGNYEKAEDLYKKAKKIRKEVFGREHLAYAESSNNLASLYFLIGHYTYDKKLAMELYQKAEPLYIEAKNIRKKILGEKHPDYAVSLNNIGALYRIMGNLSSKKQVAEDLFDKAELILIEANSIDELVFGKEHQSYAKSLHNLAVLYYDMCTKWISQEQNEDMCRKAESLFVEANKIFKDALGNRHQYYIASLFDLALLFDARNDRHLAEPLFIEGVERIKYNIRENFSFLSEEEKEHYFKTVLKDFHDFNSFALKRKKDNPEIVKYVFNNAVQNKGVLLKSSTAMRAAILESRDTTLIKQYDKWISQKKKLSKQYSLPKNKRQKDIAELEEMANDLEKELVKGSQEFSKINDLQQLTWENVKDNLKSDEAAIEYVYFKYRDKIWTDSTFYCALVIRPGYQNPKMIRLFEERELEALLGRYRGNNLNYINGIYGTNTRSKKALYNLIWQPIDSLLSDVKTVYISPSGLLHKVSFAALGNKINWYLTDNFSIQIQSTTAKVALPESFSLDKELNACIFGGIQYNTDSTKTEIWKYLVGTKTEAENISKILKKKKVNVEFISGNNANEEIFKNNASKNNIIHIATHGFFYPDPEETKKEIEIKVSSGDIAFRGGDRGFGVESFVENKNPLMRSGLVFAGANDVWSRTEVEGEDGVLTAYEISTLNLRNTQLAVLSACETGLGDIRGSEGVYGLQRAFKMAGVKYLIMSLWQVPDKETEEFMTTFYKKLLKIKDIKRAFNETQSKMRQKYDPYYWAAFVLIE